MTSAPALSNPLPDGRFIIATNASIVGVVGILSQLQKGRERVIEYFNKVLSSKQNYCVITRKLIAVIKSIDHFYKFVYELMFLLRNMSFEMVTLL